MAEEFKDCPGWVFDITEKSFGHYIITGTHFSGSKIEKEAEDANLSMLLDECKSEAKQLVIAS